MLHKFEPNSSSYVNDPACSNNRNCRYYCCNHRGSYNSMGDTEMSQFAPIAPIRVLKQLQKESPKLFGNYHLVLAHEVLEYPVAFDDLYNKPDLFVILDNSVVELGHAMHPGDLLEAASIVNANVIVLPDVIGNFFETVKASSDAYSRLKGNVDSGVEFMIVPQGSSYKEVLRCATVIRERISGRMWIGIPRWITNKLGSRIYTLTAMLDVYNSSIHLLGFSDNLADDIACARLPEVVGIDSSVPFLYGAHWKPLWLEPEMKRPSREEVWSDSLQMNYCMKHNMQKVHEWLGVDHQDARTAHLRVEL